jgi:hypothetical protein
MSTLLPGAISAEQGVLLARPAVGASYGLGSAGCRIAVPLRDSKS